MQITSTGHRRDSSAGIADGLLFVWLDTCPSDFTHFREIFCQTTISYPNTWHFFDNHVECHRFLSKAVVLCQRIAVITSGRLGQDIIGHFHRFEQIDSFFIYCQRVHSYQRFSQPFSKVIGICSDLIDLFKQLTKHLKEHSRRATPHGEQGPSLVDDTRECHAQEATEWSPWDDDCPTGVLPKTEHVMIVVRQTDSIPIQIFLSDAPHLDQMDQSDKYSLHVHVDASVTSVGALAHGVPRLYDSVHQLDQVLQRNDGHEHVYWMCLCRTSSMLTVGIGEVRPSCAVLQTNVESEYRDAIAGLAYFHVVIDGVWQNFGNIDHLRTKIRFTVSSCRLVEPQLIIAQPSSTVNLDDPILFDLDRSIARRLGSCRYLYHSLVHFRFDDSDFLDWIPAIQHSIEHPQGWCHRKLAEKIHQVGHRNRKMTSLRLTIDKFVVEIWPAGHASPVHQHSAVYGLFRVLHGSILVRLFAFLADRVQEKASLEYLLEEGQISWLSPTLNRTHQMKNVQLTSLCILVTCYRDQCEQNETERSKELFRCAHNDDADDNNSNEIRSIKPCSDMFFSEFKQQIKREWLARLQQ
jgi:hypothetical protein